MKKTILVTFLLLFFSSIVFSQNHNSSINVGEVFLIAEVSNNNYKHINFPKSNFIIKKGGIVNYKNIVGEKVEIVSIRKKKKGNIVATIKLVSKKKFFNSHKYVTIDIDEAISKKELLKIKS